MQLTFPPAFSTQTAVVRPRSGLLHVLTHWLLLLLGIVFIHYVSEPSPGLAWEGSGKVSALSDCKLTDELFEQ